MQQFDDFSSFKGVWRSWSSPVNKSIFITKWKNSSNHNLHLMDATIWRFFDQLNPFLNSWRTRRWWWCTIFARRRRHRFRPARRAHRRCPRSSGRWGCPSFNFMRLRRCIPVACRGTSGVPKIYDILKSYLKCEIYVLVYPFNHRWRWCCSVFNFKQVTEELDYQRSFFLVRIFS